jgi:hypothetical protein
VKPTRDLIAAIRKACPKGSEPDGWMATQLERVQGIRQDLAAFRLALEKAEDDHQKRVLAIHEKIVRKREVCPHYTTTYHPDPSGNNDSWRECDICGKDLG